MMSSSTVCLAARQAAAARKSTARRVVRRLLVSTKEAARENGPTDSGRTPSIATAVAFLATAAACANKASHKQDGDDDEDFPSNAMESLSFFPQGSMEAVVKCDAATTHRWGAHRTSNTSNIATRPRNVMLHRMRSVRARDMGDKYQIDWNTVLGEGAFGSVHPGWLVGTRQKVALKKIAKRFTSSTSFRTETDALLRIYDNGGHPNISGLRDMYEDYSYFYLIMDLVPGGELFDHLIQFGAYSEAEAARLMHEVASALAFLHGVGVVHADLKPENLLLSSKNQSDGVIKLIDFGCAVVHKNNYYSPDIEDSEGSLGLISPGEARVSQSGTTAYWSPQRFGGLGADAASDMWSVGVMLYIMLVGVHPFDVNGSASDKEIEAQIRKDPRPPMSPDLTGHLSSSAIDLIKKLMDPDVSRRLTAREMLQHPWVTGETASTAPMVDSDKKLSHYQHLRDAVEAGIFAVLVNQGHVLHTLSEAKKPASHSSNERNESREHMMKRAFEVFDAEGKGFVTSDDLGRIVSEVTDSSLPSKDTKDMVSDTLKSRRGADHGTAEGLSLSDFSHMFAGLKHKHFPRGHIIFHAGDEGDAMYFLNSGKVEIRTKKDKLVSILRSGDFFGEGSLFHDDNRRFTTARCSTPVDVIKIKRKDFDRYLKNSESAKKTLKMKWRARSLAYAKNLIRLQTNVKTRLYKKGDVIYSEGDVGGSMFFVDELNGGELEVKHNGTNVHYYHGGDSFGESSLLFKKPRSSTVTCVSDKCTLMEMHGSHFMAVVDSSPEMASSLRDMCRKRLFKKAVKAYSLEKSRGLSEEDLVAAFNDADSDKSGRLSLAEVRNLMHRMDPTFPESEIVALLKFIDVDEDGHCSLEEFKNLFRCFEDVEKEKL